MSYIKSLDAFVAAVENFYSFSGVLLLLVPKYYQCISSKGKNLCSRTLVIRTGLYAEEHFESKHVVSYGDGDQTSVEGDEYITRML
uniref:Uncharacterized protein n=1 Tax=Leersia perrieri TaxID=77586 RepID=A0A0D9WVC4_9ORYZ